MITLRLISAATATDAGKRSELAVVWPDLGEWLRTCADYYEAAGAYEDLVRLSDAELARRGLSRDTLARDLCGLR
jgi:hypothetical protein